MFWLGVKMSRYIDITNKKFNRLLAKERIYCEKQKKMAWRCECECGGEIIVTYNQLNRGNTKSCGCLNKENILARNTVHNESKTRLYKIWVGMRQRCNNPNKKSYNDYGGRGIRVCGEWDTFETFKEWAISNGYNDTMTIERVDPNGNYEPINCTWIPKSEQAKNRTNCNFLTFNGKTQTVSDWARELNIHRTTINNRLRKGWSAEDALTKPIQKHKK